MVKAAKNDPENKKHGQDFSLMPSIVCVGPNNKILGRFITGNNHFIITGDNASLYCRFWGNSLMKKKDSLARFGMDKQDTAAQDLKTYKYDILPTQTCYHNTKSVPTGSRICK